MKDSNIVYTSCHEKTAEMASEYHKTMNTSSRYLAYRDIPQLIAKYMMGDQALDYGSGTGISSQFLLKQNLKVTAVDISKKMLNQASLSYPHIKFFHIENGKVPFTAKSFDLIFSSFVLFEFKTKNSVIKYLKEAKRLLKESGVFIAITGSEAMYTRKWACFETTYSQNVTLKSGDKVKIIMPEANIEFTDYY